MADGRVNTADDVTVGRPTRVGGVTVGRPTTAGRVVVGLPVTAPPTATAGTLDDLADVDTTGADAGDVLTFTGADWEPRPAPTASSAPSGHVVIDQVAPNSVWTIVHNLGYAPNITCFDSAGNPISGVRQWPDPNPNTSIVRFYAGGTPASTSGQSVCS
jgi:hypothetical protein